MLGTIFSDGLIHIWCSTECLWQQDSVCWIESKVIDLSIYQSNDKNKMELYGTEEEDTSECRHIVSDFIRWFVYCCFFFIVRTENMAKLILLT